MTQQEETQFFAYWYDFCATPSGVVNNILRAVAYAGKAYHNTEQWTDSYGDQPSVRDVIQKSADEAAAHLARMEADAGRMREAIESAHQQLSDHFGHGDAEYQPAALEAISTLHAALDSSAPPAPKRDGAADADCCEECGITRGDHGDHITTGHVFRWDGEGA